MAPRTADADRGGALLFLFLVQIVIRLILAGTDLFGRFAVLGGRRVVLTLGRPHYRSNPV